MGLPNPSHVIKLSGANGDMENVHFPCWADHEQDWQPYPIDPYSAIREDHTYIHSSEKRDTVVRDS